MGAFFTHVQVRTPDLQAVVRTISEAAGDFDRVDDERFDREVLVLPPDAGGWVAIYDQATESQEGRVLDALGMLVSRGAVAFSALVHDSDVLQLTLFDDGRVLDRFDSMPGYFDGQPGRRPRLKADRWAVALAPGQRVDALRDVLSEEGLRPEVVLERVATLFGCDVARASVGHTYVEREELPEGTCVLRFRRRVLPAEESGGPPRFQVLLPLDGVCSLAVGDQLRLSVVAMNVGASSKGLGVRVFGDALDRSMVELDRIELRVGPREPGHHQTQLTMWKKSAPDGVMVWGVDSEAQAIAAAPHGINTSSSLEVWERAESAIVSVELFGRVLAPGRSRLTVVLVPLEARENAIGLATHLAIDPSLPRPLRVRDLDGVPNPSSILRPLLGDQVLVAMVALDMPQREGAEFARAALDALLRVTGFEGTLDGAILLAQEGRRPALRRGKVATHLKGARLASLLESFATDKHVELEVTRAPGQGFWGLSYGRWSVSGPADRAVPTLSCWAAAVLGEDALRALRDGLSAIIDRAMPSCLQGVLLRSSWIPKSGHTAYEAACGTSGRAIERQWLTRFVRVPGNDRLWLGPALASRVDREAVAAVADVVERDGGLVITLRERSQWLALEAALLDLLPGEADANPAARFRQEMKRR